LKKKRSTSSTGLLQAHFGWSRRWFKCKSEFKSLQWFLSRACRICCFRSPTRKYEGTIGGLHFRFTALLKLESVGKDLVSMSSSFHNLRDEGIVEFE
jgi:hypothetical protein